MDPADMPHALVNQGALLGQHDQLLRTLIENTPAATRTVAELAQQITRVTGVALPAVATRPRDPHA